jgi:hypothetical protein
MRPQSHSLMRVVLVVECLVLMTGMVACKRSVESKSAEDLQGPIQAQIDQGVEGTRTENIDLFMSVVPEDWGLGRFFHGFARR